MASREEQKRKLREEREAREAAEKRKADGRRRVQLVFGGVLAVAAVAAVVVALTAGGGGGDTPEPTSDVASVPIPAARTADLDEAVKAAGCELRTFPLEGREHIADTETYDGYKSNPPTSGNHRITPAQDGFYDPGNSPAKEATVHALEHGRIVLEYKPGTPERVIGQFDTLFNEPLRGAEGYHQLVLENQTDMPFAVAAVAWRNYVGCPSINDRVWDAFRAFREAYVDKGPELIP
jgi:hypothetical protein